MASDYLRLLREALEGATRVQGPPVRPNRTLLTLYNPQDLIVLNESLVVQATALSHPAQWGPTTSGPWGGNWQWNIAGGWG